MTHKRNGKAAKQRRQNQAQIFGAWEKCDECLAEKLVGTDCQTPHCKALREEDSIFYDHVTQDEIIYGNGTLIAGIDY